MTLVERCQLQLWPSGIGSRLGRNRLWVRFLTVFYYLLLFYFIKNICVCNAQLMQKAQQRRYKTVAVSEQKSFQSLRKQLSERVGSLRAGGREFQTPGLPPWKRAGQMSQFVFLEQAVPICQPIPGAADHEWFTIKVQVIRHTAHRPSSHENQPAARIVARNNIFPQMAPSYVMYLFSAGGNWSRGLSLLSVWWHFPHFRLLRSLCSCNFIC